MDSLQKIIGYQFKNTELLRLALIHPSIAGKKNNQRLEFLGDAVIALIVAKIVYSLYPDESEGELARRLASLVRGETLAKVARDIALGEALNVALSEIQSGGRSNPSNLEDAMEALLGAIYLDGGMEAAEAFAIPIWSTLAKNDISAPKDAKTSLQEWAQARGLPLPKYDIIETTGSAHSPMFIIEVTVKGYAPETASAASKKQAQQQAAEKLLERLTNEQ